MRLAIWAGVGSLVMASTFLIESVWHVPRLPTNSTGLWAMLWAVQLRFVVYFTPFVIGLLISLPYEKRLRNGISGSLWSQEELEPLRRRMAHPIWIILYSLSVLAWIASAITSHGLHASPLFWVLFVSTQMILRLQTIVRPKPVSPSGLSGWHNSAPIRSEHWGGPNRSHGGS